MVQVLENLRGSVGRSKGRLLERGEAWGVSLFHYF